MLSVLFISSFLSLVVTHGAEVKCHAPLPVFSLLPLSGAKLIQAISIGAYGDCSPSKALPHEHNEENVEWLCHLPVYDSVTPFDSDTSLGYFQQIFAEPYGDFAQRIWKGNCTTAQLTLRGASKLYKLGATLRSLYIKKFGLMPAEYNASRVFFAAIPTQPTKQSLFSLVLGLYPVETRRGEMITYTSYDDSVDVIKPNTKACPRLGQLYSANKKGSEWTQRMAAIKNTLDKINRIAATTGDSAWDDSTSVSTWHDTLRARHCADIPLPCKGSECVSQEDAQKVFDQADFENNNLMLGEETTRLAVSPFMFLVEEAMYAKARSNEGYDYMHFSGEPASLAAVQAAFGSLQGVPPYGSVIIFELWKSADRKFFVRARYNDEALALNGCVNPEMCGLSEFISLIKNRFTIRNITECDTL